MKVKICIAEEAKSRKYRGIFNLKSRDADLNSWSIRKSPKLAKQGIREGKHSLQVKLDIMVIEKVKSFIGLEVPVAGRVECQLSFWRRILHIS